MSVTWWRTQPVGDTALLVEFADPARRQAYQPDTHREVLALSNALSAAGGAGVIEVQPALVNTLVRFDPLITDPASVDEMVQTIGAQPGAPPGRPRVHRIEVCYDAAFAPDLAAVAEQVALSTDDVIAAHAAATYEVVMYGFAPGYAYLHGVPDRLALPRKPSAVRDVAAGSVIISGNQCLVTTIDMPTGWWVIGRSPTPMLLDDADHPFRVAVGDTVEFAAVEPDALAGSGGAP